MGLFSLTQEIAIDLGTANTIIICNDKIVVDEPSVVALDRRTDKLLAIGKVAQQMHGKAHEGIRTVRPLRDGVIAAFFAEMTEWEQYMEQVGFEDAEAVPRLLAIWEKYVSEKPRLGYRPLGISYSAQGTYNGEEFLDAEQITKNKLYIYTREKNTGFDRRFLMKRVGEGWKIDAVQERLNGWQRTEV
jgi:hypothetical protein